MFSRNQSAQKFKQKVCVWGGRGGCAKAKSKQNVVTGEWKKKKATIWFKSTTELVRQMETLKTARNEAHIFRDYIYHRSNQEQKG